MLGKGAPVLDARGVCHRFGKTDALVDVDLRLDAGTQLGLMGKNGCGKSTLLRILVGLLTPTRGEVRLLGAAPHQADESILAKLAYVPQWQFVLESLSPLDYFKVMGAAYPNFDDHYGRQLLRRFEVASERSMAGFSIGQRQRVEIARALAIRPALMILDEPLSGIDPFTRNQIVDEILTQCAEQNTTLLITTHSFGDIERTSVELALMHSGRIVQREAIADLRARYVSLKCDSRTHAEWTARLPVRSTHREPGGAFRLIVERRHLPNPLPAGCLIQEVSLEQVLLEYAEDPDAS